MALTLPLLMELPPHDGGVGLCIINVPTPLAYLKQSIPMEEKEAPTSRNVTVDRLKQEVDIPVICGGKTSFVNPFEVPVL